MPYRFTLFATVFLYGALTIIASPTAALAEKSKHRHAEASHSHHSSAIADRRHEAAELASRKHARLASLNHQKLAHLHRISQIHPVHLTRRQKAQLAAQNQDSRIRSRRERLLLEAQHRKQVALAKRMLYLAEHPSKQQLIARAAEIRAHLAEIAANRREIIAEANGDLSSKSIRAWQAYVTNVPVRLISVDLNDASVKVSALIAHNGIGSAEPFSEMIRRTQPDVAVTGTFFSLDNLKPVGDIVINGDLAYFGGMGTALCITRDNQAQMVTVPWGHHHDWSNYDFVMACGPRLLQDHEIVLDPKAERFRDKHMLSPNSRIGVGITATNKLIFVMTKDPIYLGRLAKIMRELGCSQAMNLDAGTSTGFYYEGNMMASPGRWLTNAIVVYANQHRTEASAS